MNNKRRINLSKHCLPGTLLLAVCLFALTPNVKAQDEQSLFRVFVLQNADPETTLSVLSTMLEGNGLRLDCDQQTRRILAAGNESELNKVEKIIEQLDALPKPHRTELVEVGDAPADEIADIMKQLTRPSDGTPGALDGKVRIAVEPNLNAIVVTGEEEDVRVVKEILAELIKAGKTKETRTPATSSVVRISWLVDPTRLSESESEFLEEPRKSLKELVAALNDQEAIKNGKVITSSQTLVQVNNGQGGSTSEFNSSSLRSFSGSHGMGQVSINAKGTLTAAENDKFLLSLTMDVADRENPVSIATTLTLPKNHPVAFSVSDVGSFKSAFVVEILDSQ